jgi:hypothetical protein
VDDQRPTDDRRHNRVEQYVAAAGGLVYGEQARTSEDCQRSVEQMLFSSSTGCNIKYNSRRKHKGSDDVLEGYVDAHKVHAIRQ